MENSQLKDLQEEVSEATKQYILTTFNSENGMKTYYLQMSNIIRSAHINPPIDTEYNSLKKLSKKLKQYCTFIQTLGEHEWDKGIADIQKALGIYLMQNDIESKERKQTNKQGNCLSTAIHRFSLREYKYHQATSWNIATPFIQCDAFTQILSGA